MALMSAAAIMVVLTWIFYRNLLFFAFSLPFGVMVYSSVRTERFRKNRDIERRRCRDAFLSMASALAAGYALEQSVVQADKDIAGVWGEDSDFLRRFRQMEREIVMHKPIEEAFESFASDTGLNEVKELAGLLAIAKRGGGHTKDLLREFATQLDEQLYVESEIQTHLTQKRMELNIMSLMPAFIVLYMQIGSYDMVAGLYAQLWGRVFMSVCLLLYAFAYGMGRQMLNIEV